jgi:RNA polymerase sigma-70 factor, ECF subfamily
MSELQNPLLSSVPHVWDQLVEAVDPAALLLVIDRRMGASLRDGHTSEDILQEALLHAWRDRARFEWRGIASFRSWLLSIIDHRLHDAADRNSAEKRAAGRPPVAFSVLGDGGATTSAEVDFPAGSTTPAKLAAYREQAAAMHAALEGLPEELREVVRLRIFEQCTLEEIARRLDLGFSAARHRFRRGSELYVQRLRATLGSLPSSFSLESAAPEERESSPTRGPPTDR